LGRHEARGLLESAAGGLERLCLSPQRGGTLLEQIEDGVHRGECIARQIALDAPLALGSALDQSLHFTQQLTTAQLGHSPAIVRRRPAHAIRADYGSVCGCTPIPGGR
jgi:hypothetical protein